MEEIKSLKPTMRAAQDIRAAEASLLMAEENYTEASILLESLTRENPHSTKHWLNWCACLKAMKYTVAPKRILKTAILLHPENMDLQFSFAQSLAEMGQLESYKKAHYCWKRDVSEHSNEHIYSRQFLEISSGSVDHKERRELAQYWEAQQITPETSSLWADHISISKQNRRIRVGYLSADWRNHPVGRFMLPILKLHNRKNVEVWCIDSTPKHDWISRQLKEYADHWINIKSEWITGCTTDIR